MSEKKINRQKKKKITSITPAIAQSIHNKFTTKSEIVINEIIEKIISLVISTALANKINKKVPEKCFTFIKETIENNIGICFLSHDKDEVRDINDIALSSKFLCEVDPIKKVFKEKSETEQNNSNISGNNKNNQKDKSKNSDSFMDDLFFDNYTNGKNDWDLVSEPLSNKLDRYSSTMINFVEREIKDKFRRGKKRFDKNSLEEVQEEGLVNSTIKSNLNTKYGEKIGPSNNNNNQIGGGNLPNTVLEITKNNITTPKTKQNNKQENVNVKKKILMK